MWVLLCLPHNHTHHNTLESLCVAKPSTKWEIRLGFSLDKQGRTSVQLFGGHIEVHSLTSLSVPRAKLPSLGRDRSPRGVGQNMGGQLQLLETSQVAAYRTEE